MKKLTEILCLPTEVESLSFVCRCLGIGGGELDQTLTRLRKITPDSQIHFPANFWRETAKRAKSDSDSWHEAAKVIHHETAYDRVCRQKGKPLWSFTGKLTDELISILLSLYNRLVPKLEPQNLSSPEALWILTKDVFVPTTYIVMVQQWRFGLGNEFLDECCWYLPTKSRDEVQKPLPKVLSYWMRVAGFQTGYQVAKAAGMPALRRKIDRWLTGEIVPDPLDLHKLVNKFSAKVRWLDEPDTWKARFTLACGMQNVCDFTDEYFRLVKSDSSLALRNLLRGIPKDRVVCAGNQVLTDPHCFFAVRLIQRRMKAEKKWTPTSMNQAEWFYSMVRSKAKEPRNPTDGGDSLRTQLAVREYLFELGVAELNRRLAATRRKGRRAKARRP